MGAARDSAVMRSIPRSRLYMWVEFVVSNNNNNNNNDDDDDDDDDDDKLITNYRQLAFELRAKKTWFQSQSCASCDQCTWWRYKRDKRRNWKIFLKQAICAKRLLRRCRRQF